MNGRWKSKFTTGQPKTKFRCKLCKSTCGYEIRVHRIIFGRRRWYDICTECVPARPMSHRWHRISGVAVL